MRDSVFDVFSVLVIALTAAALWQHKQAVELQKYALRLQQQVSEHERRLGDREHNVCGPPRWGAGLTVEGSLIFTGSELSNATIQDLIDEISSGRRVTIAPFSGVLQRPARQLGDWR